MAVFDGEGRAAAGAITSVGVNSAQVGYDTMSVSHTGQKGEDQSGRAWGGVVEKSIDEEQTRPDQTRQGSLPKERKKTKATKKIHGDGNSHRRRRTRYGRR